uniref:Uncharacterized protein n=1 Tax=Catagonus wagneri TaxID=51154 RepID=A0A8C3YWV5_9CETA
MLGNGVMWGHLQSCLCTFPERLEACGTEAMAYGRCVQAFTAPGQPPGEESLHARVRGPAGLLHSRGQEDPNKRSLGSPRTPPPLAVTAPKGKRLKPGTLLWLKRSEMR